VNAFVNLERVDLQKRAKGERRTTEERRAKEERKAKADQVLTTIWAQGRGATTKRARAENTEDDEKGGKAGRVKSKQGGEKMKMTKKIHH
jgi:hypothetical protein